MSHITAITRRHPSAPMRHLFATDRLVGRKLDYGGGKGRDAATYNMDCYDPHYQPIKPFGPFDTITCNYVLNVIESAEERLQVLHNILALLADDGSAYITVRADTRALKGTTQTGSWQGFIVLNLPIVRRERGFVIYLLQQEHLGQIEMSLHTF